MTKREARQKIRNHIEKKGHISDFKITPRMVSYWHNVINIALFNGHLPKPHKIIYSTWQNGGGQCYGYEIQYLDGSKEAYAEITIYGKQVNRLWFMQVLIHEMVHQYEIYTVGTCSHGNRHFWSWGPKVKNLLGLKLIRYVPTK